MSIILKNCKLYFQFQLDGHTYYGSTGLADTPRNRVIAEQREADEKLRIREGREPLAKIAARHFIDAAGEFREHVISAYDKPNSSKRILTSLSSLILYFDRRMVMQIDEARIEDYMHFRRTESQVAEVTLRHDLHALSLFFQWAIRRKYASRNVVASVALPSDADAVREHVLTIAEEKAYFSAVAANTNLYDLGRLILLQGFRPDEAMCLEKKAFDEKRRTIRVLHGKSKAARRTLDLTEEAYGILLRRGEGSSPWVFPSYKRPGHHITKLTGPHFRACQKLRLSFCLYDLRHTFATRMAQAGIDLPTLGRTLGHANLRTLMRYVHIEADHAKAAMQRYEAAMKAAEAEWNRSRTGSLEGIWKN
jgi:integrase